VSANGGAPGAYAERVKLNPLGDGNAHAGEPAGADAAERFTAIENPAVTDGAAAQPGQANDALNAPPTMTSTAAPPPAVTRTSK